jgi:hypothetical protein
MINNMSITLPTHLIQFILDYCNDIWVLRFLQNEISTKMVINKKNRFVQILEDHWKHRITNYRTYYEEGTRYGKLYDKIVYYMLTPTQDIAVAFEYNCIISYGYIQQTYNLTDKYYEDLVYYEDKYYEKVKYFACLTKFV